MFRGLFCGLLAIANLASATIPFCPGFDIKAVISLAISLPSHSWEYGTASEALLELYNPTFSVFGEQPFPIPELSPSPSSPSYSPSLEYAKQKIVLGAPPNTFSDGDGATGDPASLGVSGMLLGINEANYADAAKTQVEYLLQDAPRWSNGAISQRADHAELW